MLTRPAIRLARYGLNEPRYRSCSSGSIQSWPEILPRHVGGPALALELVVVAAVGGGVVVGELLADGDVAEGDEHDVAAEARSSDRRSG